MRHGDIAEYVWKHGIPFLTNRAIDYMESVIRPEFNIFEWGAGGSTLWFARRAAKIVSVEHQRAWYDKIMQRLIDENIKNVELLSIPHRPPEQYARAILQYPAEYFSLLLIDGRERVRCIEQATDRIRLGGYLVLDNTERPRYDPGIVLLDGWERLDFKHGWTTSIFVKPMHR